MDTKSLKFHLAVVYAGCVPLIILYMWCLKHFLTNNEFKNPSYVFLMQLGLGDILHFLSYMWCFISMPEFVEDILWFFYNCTYAFVYYVQLAIATVRLLSVCKPFQFKVRIMLLVFGTLTSHCLILNLSMKANDF